MSDPKKYEYPYRTNHECHLVFIWFFLGLTSLYIQFIDDKLPQRPYQIFSLFCFGIGVWFSFKAIELFISKKRLKGYPLCFLEPNCKEILKAKKNNIKNKEIWLGWGNEWTQKETQLIYELSKRSMVDILGESDLETEKGQGFIHGVLEREKEIKFPISLMNGHTLITGASGSGKTRIFDLIISQLIERGETCILYDPKNDHDIKELCKKTLESLGRSEDFLFLNPSYPRESIRINPLKTFGKSSEISNRVVANIDSGGDRYYVDLCFTVVQSIVDAMHIIGEQVSLVRIKYYFSNYETLIEKTICEWMTLKRVDWRKDFISTLEKLKDPALRAACCISYYEKKVEKKHPSSEIQLLIDFLTTKRKAFENSTGSLTAALTKLTIGEMAELLSPSDLNDHRPMYDIETIITNKKVLFVGSASLADRITSSAITKMFLAELACIASNRYDYKIMKEELGYINIFVDEASEVVCESLLQLVNKSRGAKFRIFIATQGISDFIAEMGDEAMSNQFLSSLNNVISTRSFDKPSQEKIVAGQPTTRVKYIAPAQVNTSSAADPTAMGGNVSERMVEEEVELFSIKLMAKLPDCEYVAQFADGKLIKGRVPIQAKKREA
ncbi:hypothetical protein ABT56_18750 [Photobacterium aquae]|uniref:TraD/TraG TraM recognition site domain-containing protein n=1 Tax=Photobacterium aquae TaxID=1195763 RepID=A0A0J1GVL3_9GAMM|nr:conjugative transfer system coupling protein TraD [Photobacterium aquae]KLV03479.1 hypothetical protein ABT56_18750 [Photobacterium aquae]